MSARRHFRAPDRSGVKRKNRPKGRPLHKKDGGGHDRYSVRSGSLPRNALVPFQLVLANPSENTFSVFASDAWSVIGRNSWNGASR